MRLAFWPPLSCLLVLTFTIILSHSISHRHLVVPFYLSPLSGKIEGQRNGPRFYNFSDASLNVIMLSQEYAKLDGAKLVYPNHLLNGLRSLKDPKLSPLLNDLEIPKVEPIESLPESNDTINFSKGSKECINYSYNESKRLGHTTIEPAHILLGVIAYATTAADDGDEGFKQIFKMSNKNLNELVAKVCRILCDYTRILEPIEIVQPSYTTPANIPGLDTNPISLSDFSKDLTEQAKLGKLTPIVGRTSELDSVVRILSKKTKCCPILIGDPGVGKTAVVEALAQKIINSDPSLPKEFLHKKVIMLDIGLVVSGTKFRGQFEERLNRIIDEVRERDDVILVLDEVHMLIGAGGGEGGLDAANILKPVLSRGEIQCIGITTFAEYQTHFEKDLALSRRFHPVYLREPDEKECIDILKGIAKHYEQFHNVQYTDEAIQSAVKLSGQCASNRHLPDRAIDILDESGSLVKIKRSGAEDDQLAAIVTKDDIKEIVKLWTGTSGINDVEEISNMLKGDVIGQDEAVESLCQAIVRSKSGVRDPKRTIGNFLFCGPSGVGKTQMAKALAKYYFSGNEKIIHLDMSEYMEPHSISRMIGSPPGYKGHDAGGQLCTRVRKSPNSVIMFDEIEKAHPDVLNILLQILDEGRLTDAKGNVTSFTSTIIVLTSNVGSGLILNENAFGFNTSGLKLEKSKVRLLVEEELKRFYRPELLNRIDKVVIFDKLSHESLREIIKLHANKVLDRVTEMGYKVRVGDSMLEHILKQPTEAVYGARSVLRHLTKFVEDPLSNAIIAKQLRSDVDYTIEIVDGNSKIVEVSPVITGDT
ncbi:AAA domain (Cdc48 subfamily) [Babesia microti strain RI]|uniref:AAA domain (Cdc48 subfamily) n=1 Tax=Babesia microti (strain RI) TaxID=1133968 RepID=A0A1N6LXS9_BABMR|nr:AAA domain (Cdc48 subfamily) [Babesia microti strain RI]SIO73689.1 AAA domain (Cdc48 subfamily) [Babesia microti strain RI]|eukprot:XP_021337757.1 AAA domain (Cdc48 subfamily) [Babesia microti strain RI]